MEDLLKQQGVLNVRITFRCATLVATLLALCVSAPQAFAQNGAGGVNVVVIDITKTFKEHNRFNAALEVMKKDVEAFEAYVRRQREAVQTMTEELKGLNAGSPDYKALEAKIAKIMSDLQVEISLKRKDFMEREAKLYFNTYTEVTNEVAKFAEQYRINLVLRYNSEKPNADDRASIMQAVNADVVYQYKRDITDTIIKKVNEGIVPEVGDTRGNNSQIPVRPNN